MATFSRMPRYDVRNDGFGPYAVYYCDACEREFRSQPDAINTFTQDIGKSAMSGLLRKVPLVGNTLANNALGEDPRYTYSMTPVQLEAAWKQVQVHFRECPTCSRLVCLSDFDTQSGFCQDDSPRTNEIAEARGEQTGAALKGLANAFGLGETFKNVEKASKAAADAASQVARCPSCDTMAAPGTKFCPECGSAMIQPESGKCPKCGAEVHGAKFCPECGTKMEQKPANCPSCGADVKGARFCPECGTKVG